MKINEVMKETGLTKKSIYYYENEGLISPKKDPSNNYRNYTDEDVRKLIKINILRRLEIPIKSIGDIIHHEIPVKEVLKKQLVLTNQKINNLHRNKVIMNEWIIKDLNEKDFSPDTLKDYDLKLDSIMEASGDLGKEIVRLFPGTLGKLFAIFYNDFLNVPLDSDVKITAWKQLIQKLDDMSDIEYPEDIKQIVEDIYNNLENENPDLYNESHDHNNPFSDYPSPILKESMEDYSGDSGNCRRIEGYYRLQSFILSNLAEFKEVGAYIGIINEKYSIQKFDCDNSKKLSY